MKLSLVVASVERTVELQHLLKAFSAQTFRDFEVIIVDQNADDRLLPIVAHYSSCFPVRHIRSAICNCSHARNIGLQSAVGEIVGFPDDDCMYQEDTMGRVVHSFEMHPEWIVLSGNAISPVGQRINGRWNAESCRIDEKTVWTTVMGFTVWMRTDAAREVGGFDTAIGPGTPWGSSEEPDLVLRLLAKGYYGYYDASLGVLHPDKTMSAQAIARAFLYGAGMGRVLRKHSLGPSISLPYFIRPIGGVVVSLLRARLLHAHYYWSTFWGRLTGYMAAPTR